MTSLRFPASNLTSSMFSVLYGKARLCEFNNLQILFLSTLVYYITAVKFFWVFVWYVIAYIFKLFYQMYQLIP